MPKPVHDLHLDFETFCDLDLKKVGVYRYVEHPSFRILCVAWRVDARAVVKAQGYIPPDLKDLLANRNVQGHAFNAAFETAVLKQLGVPVANPISCTMQRALAYGLPGSLAAACFALSLTQQKDAVGHKLMLKMTKPQKPGAKPWTVSDYSRLAEYCAHDVEAESDLADVIPPLPPDEWELSQLDAAMNTGGGLGIDLHRVSKLAVIAEAAEKAEAARCTLLTGGAVTSPGTQTARLKAWLDAQGVPLPSTERAVIEEALADPNAIPAVVLEVLQIRLRTARASNKKLKSMLVMSSDKARALHGQFQFCGAGRTGRWSGRGVQVQNLPRPKGFDAQLFYDMAAADVGNIGTVASAPLLDCVSWSLRSCLKATDDDMIMWSFDFSQIEARVLAWLAGQNDILAVFATGHDVYVWAAAQFGSKDRQLGKVLVLALGFGMGAAKLKDTAWKSYGVKLTLPQAEAFKTLWRQRNHYIVEFWAEMEAAARGAILRRGSVQAVGGTGVAFTCTARTLRCVCLRAACSTITGPGWI